jgi:hypothetical protein
MCKPSLSGFLCWARYVDSHLLIIPLIGQETPVSKIAENLTTFLQVLSSPTSTKQFDAKETNKIFPQGRPFSTKIQI